jgi:hypothetical protein
MTWLMHLGIVTYEQAADGYKQELFLKGAMVSTITGSECSDSTEYETFWPPTKCVIQKRAKQRASTQT